MIILRKIEQKEYSTKGTQLLKKGVQLGNVFKSKGNKLSNMAVNRKTIDLKNKLANVSTSIQSAALNPGDAVKKATASTIEKPLQSALIVSPVPGGMAAAPFVGKAEGKMYGKWTKKAADKFRGSKLAQGVEKAVNGSVMAAHQIASVV